MFTPEAADQMMFQTTQVVNPAPRGRRHPILVPVDFASCSRAALVFAIDFIRCLEVPLLILHVVHEAGGDGGNYRKYGGVDNVRPIEDIAVDMLEEFINGVKEELESAEELDSARKMVVRGLPASRINEVAERENAAFIIMGTHGRVGLSRLAMGSVAEKVLQCSHIPVTVIKNRPAETENSGSALSKGSWIS
jgi:nucleotide-binding universal stress UspA family protein